MYLSMTTSVHIPQCSRRENETKQKRDNFMNCPAPSPPLPPLPAKFHVVEILKI